MNKLIPIFTCHDLSWDDQIREDIDGDTDEPLWFSLQYWCMQTEDFHYIDLTPIPSKERLLIDGRFALFKKTWDTTPTEEIPIEISAENINDLLSWTGQNIKNNWGIAVDHTREYNGEVINSLFQFENEADAAFFKLTWA